MIFLCLFHFRYTSPMKFLIFWDIYGKVGRKMITKYLPDLRAKYSPDVVIANNENMSHGRWPRMNQIEWLEQQWVDIFTGGNHTFDSIEDIRAYMDAPDSKQLRPDNLIGDNLPWTGHREFTFWDKKVLIINLIGNLFMDERCVSSNPFQKVDTLLKNHDSPYEAILVDFHKETTSEWYAMANYLDGRVSLLWGTHTHIQTADAEIWPGWMGFINDLGFAGARRSVIGVEWRHPIQSRWIDGKKDGPLSPDDHGPGVISGMFAEIVDKKCRRIEPFRICE